MNTVTSADSSYYAANTNEKTEKGPCLAMTPYGVIGAERVNTQHHVILDGSGIGNNTRAVQYRVI